MLLQSHGRRFSTLLSPSLAVAVLTSAAAAQNGYVGVFGDAAGTIRCMQAAPGVPTTLYVVAFTAGATAAGVSGAEFRIEVQNPTGYFMSYSAPQNSLPLGDPLGSAGLNIAWSTCQVPVDGKVQLGTIAVFNAGSGQPTDIIVKRRNPPSNSSYPCALFTQCDAPVYTKSCMTFPPDSVSCLAQKVGIRTGSTDEFKTSMNVTAIGQVVESVSGGVVYGYGIRFSEPYRFSVLGDTLYLNDVPYLPSRPVEQLVLAPVTSRIERKHALMQRAFAAADGQSTIPARLAAIEATLREDSLVTSVRSSEAGMWVRFVGDSSEELFTVDTEETSPPSVSQLHQQAIDEFKQAAARGMLIAFGDGYRITSQPQRLAASQALIDQVMAGAQVNAADAQNTALWHNTRFVDDLYRQRARITGR